MVRDDYQMCRNLVMDTSDPSIKFDSDGVCNYYHRFHNTIKKNWFPDEIGKAKLRLLCDKIRSEGVSQEFDCIIGLSGGLDSSFLLHTAVTQYGLRPLVFHVDGGWNSEIAVRNINALISKLGLDLYTEVIDWVEMRNFQLALFKAGVPHLDLPQDHAFVSVLYKFAVENNIKYILNGGNIATEAVSPPVQLLYWGTDLRHINHILEEYGNVSMHNYPFSSAIYHKFYLRAFKNIRVVKPLNFLNFQKNDAVKELFENYGWIDYGQKHFESRFTKFFEGYWLPTRFGFDMRRCQFSSLILSNQMTRDQALKELNGKPYDSAQVEKDIEYVAAKLDISVSQLLHYHEMPLKFYSDYKNSKLLFDVGEKILSLLFRTQRGGAY